MHCLWKSTGKYAVINIGIYILKYYLLVLQVSTLIFLDTLVRIEFIMRKFSVAACGSIYSKEVMIQVLYKW